MSKEYKGSHSGVVGSIDSIRQHRFQSEGWEKVRNVQRVLLAPPLLEIMRASVLYYNHDTLSDRQKYALAYIFKQMHEGKTMTGHDLVRWGMIEMPEIEGQENLPKTGPVIIVSNHHNSMDGGLRTFAQMTAVTYAIEDIRRNHTDDIKTHATVRWVQACMPKNKWVKHVAFPVWEEFNKAFDEIRVDKEGDHFYPNPLPEIFSVLDSDGIFGIHPEADDSFALLQINRKAEGLLTLLQRKYHEEVPIIPVVGYKEGDRFKVIIGRQVFTGPKQKLGEAVMHAIRDMLPPQLHGYYAEKRQHS